MRLQEHRRDQRAEAVFAIVVTSDTRKPETDETGRTAIGLIEGEGHEVAAYEIVENDGDKIREAVRGLLGDGTVQVILTSGGTGISPRDRTVDAVEGLLDKRMEGFGELFRRLSFDEVGGAAMISRATAGVAGGKLIFCLPGSRNAVELALKKIILPNVGHMLWEVGRE